MLTVEHAFMAHAVLRVHCTRCDHHTNMYSWAMYNARKEKIETMPLGQPVPGFWCRGCRRNVAAVMTVVGYFDYGT
jgi:hypothetical protein